MHLEDKSRAERDAGSLDVDVLQDVSVAGDLLLRAVPGCGAAGDDVGNTVVGRKDTLDAVRGFGAFDLGGVLERLENLGRLLGIKLLAALVFAKLADGLEKPLGKRLSLDKAGQKGMH
jgi:hypothetical protein